MCYLSSIEGVYHLFWGAGDEKHLCFEDYTVQNNLLLSVCVLFLTVDKGVFVCCVIP